MNMMDADLVKVEPRSDHVWVANLNSPQDRNALSKAMRDSILSVLDSARTNGVKVVIIRGDGTAFSSGYKLDPGVMRPTTLTEDRSRLVEVSEFLRAYRAHSTVTIAEVEGYCVAGGTDLMLTSDIVVAEDDAKIGTPNVRGLGISLLLPAWSWAIGPQRAKLMALTGDFLSGAEAARLGLVAAALPAAKLRDRVHALADRIAMTPTELLETAKHAVNAAWESGGLSIALTRAAELDALSHGTRPVIEFWDSVVEDGLRQALKKRDQDFAGSRAIELLELDDGAVGQRATLLTS